MDNDVLTHFWLKHPGEELFHAYLATAPGTSSLCGRSPAITKMADMDIPGDRSVCCIHCFSKLYKFNPYELPCPTTRKSS